MLNGNNNNRTKSDNAKKKVILAKKIPLGILKIFQIIKTVMFVTYKFFQGITSSEFFWANSLFHYSGFNMKIVN